MDHRGEETQNTFTNTALPMGFLDYPLGNGGATISTAYTSVLADRGLLLAHDLSDNSARTFTIDSYAHVAYPKWTVLLFLNLKNTLTIAATDTMTLANSATTGNRTLAVNGTATALLYDITASVGSWLIWGVGLT